VIDDKIDDNANPTRMAFLQQLLEIFERAIIRVDVLVIGDIITMIGG